MERVKEDILFSTLKSNNYDYTYTNNRIYEFMCFW